MCKVHICAETLERATANVLRVCVCVYLVDEDVASERENGKTRAQLMRSQTQRIIVVVSVHHTDMQM